eukprot:jgi/Galph1/184/GphlegSOOS_G4927.1
MASLVAFAFSFIAFSLYILLFFLYVPQITGRIVSKLCNHIFFRNDAHITIHSLRLISLAGKVVLKGLRYTTVDATVFAENMEISLLWWRALFLKRNRVGANTAYQDRSQESPAAFIVAQGLQIRLVNQKARYDFIQRILEQKADNWDKQAPVSLLAEEFEGYSLWLYQYLGPVVFHLQFCSLVINDPAIPDIVMLSFEGGKGRYVAVPAPCPLDIYRSVYKITVQHLQVQHSSVCVDMSNSETSQEANENHIVNERNDLSQNDPHMDSILRSLRIHSSFDSKQSIVEEAVMTVIDSPQMTRNSTTDSIRIGTTTFMNKFGSFGQHMRDICERFLLRLRNNHSSQIGIQERNILFEADTAEVEYYNDIPGITILCESQESSYHDPPMCCLKVSCAGSRIVYSPRLERARQNFLGRFFPATYENIEIDTALVKEGKKRKHRCFQAEFSLRAKEDYPLLEIRFHPRAPDTNNRSTKACSLYLWCRETCNFSLVYPYMICSEETEANLEFCANLDETNFEIESGKFPVFSAPMLTVEGKLGYPLIWNGYRKWILDIRLLSSRMTFIRELINIVSDIVSEISENQEYDPCGSFVPTEYFINMEFQSGYSLFLSANPSNIWSSMNKVRIDNEWVFEVTGNALKLKFHFPSGVFPMPLTFDMNWILTASNLQILIHWPLDLELKKQLGSFQKVFDVSNFDVQCSHSYWNITVPGYQDRVRVVFSISDVTCVVNPFHVPYFFHFLDNYFGKHIFIYLNSRPVVEEYFMAIDELSKFRTYRETSLLMNIQRLNLVLCAGVDAAVKVPGFFSYLRLKIPYCSFYQKMTKTDTNGTLNCPRLIEVIPYARADHTSPRNKSDTRRLYIRGLNWNTVSLFGNRDIEYTSTHSLRIESCSGQLSVQNLRCFFDLVEAFRLASAENPKVDNQLLEGVEFEVASLDFKIFEDEHLAEVIVPSGLKLLASNLRHSSVSYTTNLEIGLILIALLTPRKKIHNEARTSLVRKIVDSTEYVEVSSFASRLSVSFQTIEAASSGKASHQLEELKAADFNRRNLRFLWMETNETIPPHDTRSRRGLYKQFIRLRAASDREQQGTHSLSRQDPGTSSSHSGFVSEALQEFWSSIKYRNEQESNVDDEQGCFSDLKTSSFIVTVPESMKLTLSPCGSFVLASFFSALVSGREEIVELVISQIWKRHLEQYLSSEERKLNNLKLLFKAPEVKIKVRSIFSEHVSSYKKRPPSSNVPEMYFHFQELYLRWYLAGSRSKSRNAIFGIRQVIAGVLLDTSVEEHSKSLVMKDIVMKSVSSTGKETAIINLEGLTIGDNLPEIQSFIHSIMIYTIITVDDWATHLKRKPNELVPDIFSIFVISGETSNGLITSGGQVRKIFLSALSRVRAMSQTERLRILNLLKSSNSHSYKYRTLENRRHNYELFCNLKELCSMVENVSIIRCSHLHIRYLDLPSRHILVLLINELGSQTSIQLLTKIAAFVRASFAFWETQSQVIEQDVTGVVFDRREPNRKEMRSMPEQEILDFRAEWKPLRNVSVEDNGNDALLQSLSTAPLFFSSSRRVNYANMLTSTLSTPLGEMKLALGDFEHMSPQNKVSDSLISPYNSNFLRSLSSFGVKTTWNELDAQPSSLTVPPVLFDILLSVDKMKIEILSTMECTVCVNALKNVSYIPFSSRDSLERSSVLCSSETMNFEMKGPGDEELIGVSVLAPQYTVALQQNGNIGALLASTLSVENVSLSAKYSILWASGLIAGIFEEVKYLFGERDIDVRTTSSQIYNIPPVNIAISETKLQLELGDESKRMLQYKVEELRATSCELSATENIIVIRAPSQQMGYLYTPDDSSCVFLELPSAVIESRSSLAMEADKSDDNIVTHYHVHLAFKAVDGVVTKERIGHVINIIQDLNRPRQMHPGKPKPNLRLMQSDNKLSNFRFFTLVVSLQTMSLTSTVLGVSADLFLDNWSFTFRTNGAQYPDLQMLLRNVGIVFRLQGSLPARLSVSGFHCRMRFRKTVDSSFIERLRFTSISSVKDCEAFIDKRCISAIILLADEFKYYECDDIVRSNDSFVGAVTAAASRLFLHILLNVRVGAVRVTWRVDENYDIRVSALSPSLSLRIENVKTVPRYRTLTTGSFESVHIFQHNTPILTFQGSRVDFSSIAGNIACFMDVGSYTLSLDHAIRLLPEASQPDHPLETTLITSLDLGVNINSGIVTLKSTKFVDTDIQLPGMYANVFLDSIRQKKVFFCDFDYSNIDFVEGQLEHILNWFRDRTQDLRSSNERVSSSGKDSGTPRHRRMKTIATFASSSPKTSALHSNWSLIIRFSNLYMSLKESFNSPFVLSATASIPEACLFFSPFRHPDNSKMILLGGGLVHNLDFSLTPSFNVTSNQRCFAKGIQFLIDVNNSTGILSMQNLLLDLELASLLSIQNLLKQLKFTSNPSGSFAIQPRRRANLTVCIRESSDMWPSNVTRNEPSMKVSVKMVQQSSGSVDLGFYSCHLYCGYLDDINFVYMNFGRGSIYTTRQRFKGSGGFHRIFFSRILAPSGCSINFSVDAILFKVAQSDGLQAEDILKLGCTKLSLKVDEGYEEILRQTKNEVDGDVYLKGLTGALSSTSSSALQRLRDSIFHLMSETKRLSSTIHFATALSDATRPMFATESRTTRNTSFDKQFTDKLRIHGDHIVLSLFAFSFREQSFIRIVSSNYLVTFDQTASRNRGENRQLDIEFESFSIEHYSSDRSVQGDILRVPNPNLRLKTFIHSNEFYYDFFTKFDSAVQISSRFSQYRYMQEVLRLYLSKDRSNPTKAGDSNASSPASLSQPSISKIINNYNIHRKRLVLEPKLNALGELTPSLDTLLSWLGLGDADTVPLLIYQLILEKLNNLINVLASREMETAHE